MDDAWPQVVGGGAFGAFGLVCWFVLRLMLRADNVARAATDFAVRDRDDCLDALDRERAARLDDRARCDEMIAELRVANAHLEARVAVLEYRLGRPNTGRTYPTHPGDGQ